MNGADDQRAARDQASRDEQDRNRRLADRIATSGAPLDDEMIATMRQMAGANLNVPGPRVVQLLAEYDGLRAELAETTVAAKTWEDKFRRVRDQLQGEADAHAATLAEQRESRDIVWWMGANLGRAYTAGDALAAAGRDLYDVRRWSSEDETEVQQRFLDAHGAWRSARGDARTEPSRCTLCGCHHRHDDADVVSGPRGCALCRYCSGSPEVRGDARTAPAADVREPASETHRTSAAPTAAPDVRAWEDDGDWGWACSRCGYRSVAWWADRATARRAAHEHGRDRCPAAGGSSPASTAGGDTR